MNTLPIEVLRIAMSEVMAAVSMTNAMGPPRPSRRLRAKASVSGLAPPSSKASVLANTSPMPVKLWSNSSIGTLTWPRAGSLIRACLPEKPLSTTKWLKFQKMMQGKEPFSRIASLENDMPLAVRPYDRAAFRMLDALLPSRDTPQSARTRSSGTQRP